MTVGLPITFSFQGSSIKEDVLTIDELMSGCRIGDPLYSAPIFEDGFKLRADGWIFEYQSKANLSLKIWNSTDQAEGVYDIDEVIVKNCKLIKVTGKKGTGITTHRKPLEPEKYSGWDSGIDHTTYTHRYMRVSNKSQCGWLGRTWMAQGGTRFYCMFWECRGFGGCGKGAWRWQVKDLQHTGWDTNQDYQRTCFAKTYSNKYNSAKDVRAKVYKWKSPDSAGSSKEIIMFRSMIERNGYFYFRTHLDLPPQYKTWETGTEFSYTFTDVVTPDDIPNFKQKELICALKPFDGKNYTFCNPILTGEDDFKVTWSLLNVGEFDSIAFGSIICEKVDIKVTTIPEADGSFEILSELNGYPVDNTLHSESDIVYPSTVVLYMDKMISRESVIEVTIHGKGEVQIGEILGAKSIDGGFTKPSFKNTFKDFSPKEQDQWGNWTYIDGVKVQVHSGTVEFPILRYDQLNRLMLLMGGSKVVVNSSDSIKNEIPDGRSIFEATMMIARFTKFNLDSSEKNKRIGESGKYTFSIEEIV